ncbi:MAG: YitT family protein, partial [Bacteroidales bacterium]|nr:YitT family protein [Bacteroidales bacterium]
VGQLLIVVDSVIVLFGLVAFRDWRIPLYSWVVIFITGKVVDYLLEGAVYHKSLFIISDKYEEIRQKLLFDLGRGGTLLTGIGMYEGKERKIIFANVSRREMILLKSYIHSIDPEAFITVFDASEVLGEGFKPLKE